MSPLPSTEPVLTVVVPSVNGWSDLEGCLASLEREAGTVPLEVLVPERCGGAVRQQVATRFPWVRLIPVSPATTIPAMRATAFDLARADAVAVIEDHVLVRPGWAQALLSVRQRGAVIGGSVANGATARLVDWAAFLCEYSHLLPPIPSGPSTWVTGNNTLYERATLAAHRSVTHAGLWENHLHAAIRASGGQLVAHPEIVVDHRKHYSMGEYLRQRYWYSRSHAAARVAGSSRLARLAFGVAALALPPVLLGRIVGRALRKDLSGWLVFQCTPLIALFSLSWAWGELAGAWFGAGDASERVK